MMRKKEFPIRLEQSLQQTALNVPEQVDLWPQIRRQALEYQERELSHPHNRFFQTRNMFRQRKEITIVAALAFVLVVSAFVIITGPVLFQLLGDNALQKASQGHITSIQQSVTVKGVTLQLDGVYADAARTAITYHAATVNSPRNTNVVLGEMTLRDETGHVYQMNEGDGEGNDSLGDFMPVLTDHPGQSTTLTFSVSTMTIMPIPNLAAQKPAKSSAQAIHILPDQQVSGPWKITFNVTPVAGRTLTLTNAPQTYNGISVQPTRLDIAPSGTRLFLHLRGLPAETLITFLNMFATRFTGPNGSGGHTTDDSALLLLHLPNGQTIEPVTTDTLEHSKDQPNGNQDLFGVVGSSGDITLEVIFYTDLSQTHGAITITLNKLSLKTLSDDKIQNYNKYWSNGSWNFTIHL
jgi:hypothetical protein